MSKVKASLARRQIASSSRPTRRCAARRQNRGSGPSGHSANTGGVAVVAAEDYKNNSVANTIKDVLGYVPGVFAQPKWGDDTRLSIRGSSLSRNFHLRGVQLYMDGIPINTSDGYGDFQEIDPTAYKYVEVYKGANALQFGANSLGGAINFVTPTGRDAGVNSAGVDMGRSAIAASRAVSAARAAPGMLSSPPRTRAPKDSAITATVTDPRQRQYRLPVLAGFRDALLHQCQ
jgi:outer membrane receptor protein involved in Fe transport